MPRLFCKVFVSLGVYVVLGLSTLVPVASGQLFGTEYLFYVQYGDKTICIQAMGDTAGSAVKTQVCDGANTQQYFQINQDGTISAIKESFCLDAKAGLSGKLTIEPCNGSDTQHWYTSSLPGNLENQGAGGCLDIRHGNTDPNADAILWGCHNHWNQLWKVQLARQLTVSTYQIKVDNRCIDTQSFDAGQPLVVYSCHDGASQRFAIDDALGTIWFDETGFCLDGYKGKGEPVTAEACDGSLEQQWETLLLPRGEWSGKGIIQNMANGLCINVEKESKSNNARLILWECGWGPGGTASGWNDKFTAISPELYSASTIAPDAVPVEQPRPQPTVKVALAREETEIVAAAYFNNLDPRGGIQAMCIDAPQGETGTGLTAHACHGNGNQRLRINGDGTINIFFEEYCLDGRNGRDKQIVFDLCDGSAAQQWYTNALPGRLKNKGNDLCADIKNEKLDNGTWLILWDCGSGDDWNQIFAAGDLIPQASALVIQRTHTPLIVGHTAWGFELPAGRWVGGAWDGSSWPVNMGINPHFKEEYASLPDILETFARTGGMKGGSAYNNYDWYKHVAVTNANTAAALAMERRSYEWDYFLFTSNCLDQAYRILTAYGVDYLPWPFPAAAVGPNIWFNLISGVNQQSLDDYKPKPNVTPTPYVGANPYYQYQGSPYEAAALKYEEIEAIGQKMPRGPCQDDELNRLWATVIGRDPYGEEGFGECDPRLYAGGDREALLEGMVRGERFADGQCREARLTQALREVTGRAPDGIGELGVCLSGIYGTTLPADDEALRRRVADVLNVSYTPAQTVHLYDQYRNSPYETAAQRYVEMMLAEDLGPALQVRRGPCSEPELTSAWETFVGRLPYGHGDAGECDMRLYARPDGDVVEALQAMVRGEVYGDTQCRDMRINQAYLELMNASPAGIGELAMCNGAVYGSWTTYEELKASIRGLYGLPGETAPTTPAYDPGVTPSDPPTSTTTPPELPTVEVPRLPDVPKPPELPAIEVPRLPDAPKPPEIPTTPGVGTTPTQPTGPGVSSPSASDSPWSLDLPTNQPTNQPVDQPVDQPGDEPAGPVEPERPDCDEHGDEESESDLLPCKVYDMSADQLQRLSAKLTKKADGFEKDARKEKDKQKRDKLQGRVNRLRLRAIQIEALAAQKGLEVGAH